MKFKPTRQTVILTIIFLFFAARQLFLVMTLPPWQNHDEPAHFFYTSYLVEEKKLPLQTGAIEPRTLSFSEEYAKSELITDTSRLMKSHNEQLRRVHQRFRDYELDYAQISRTLTGLSRDIMVRSSTDPQYFNIYYRLPADGVYKNSAAPYQPLYYALEAIPYLLFYHQDIIVRLYALRIFSTIFYLLTLWLCFLTARRLKGSFNFSLTLLLIIGLLPVYSHLMAGVNNEALLIMLTTLSIYCLIRLLQNFSLKNTVLLGITLGLGMLTKPQFAAIPLLAIIPFGYHWAKNSLPKKKVIYLFALCAIIATLLSGWWFAWSWENQSSVFSATDSNNEIITGAPGWKTAAIYYLYRWMYGFASFFYAFGFATEMVLPRLIIVFLTGLFILSLIGLVKGATERYRFSSSARKAENWILAISILLLELFFLYIFSKTLWQTGQARFPIDGRYYLPVAFSVIYFWLLGLKSLLPVRLHNLLYSTLSIAMIVINAVAIFYTILPKFFL